MWQQVLKFGMVGGLATALHMVVGIVLIFLSWNPLAANLVAFLTAFVVSFVGHFGYSFADQNARFSSALWKFAIVGILGFSFNETLLFTLLTLQFFPDPVALFLSTGCAAVLTFFLSRTWAFKNTDGQSE